MAVICSKQLKVPKLPMISFTIDGTLHNTKEGMTWYQWVNSSYNILGFTCASSTSAIKFIKKGQPVVVVYNTKTVFGNDLIYSNRAYMFEIDGSGGGAN